MFAKSLSCQILIPTSQDKIELSQIYFAQSDHLRRRYLDAKWPGDSSWCYRPLPAQKQHSQVLFKYNSAFSAGYCRSIYTQRKYPFLPYLSSTTPAQYELQNERTNWRSQIKFIASFTNYAHGDLTYNNFCDEDFCANGLFYGSDEAFRFSSAQINILLQARNHLSAQVLIPKEAYKKMHDQLLLHISNFQRLNSDVRIAHGFHAYNSILSHAQIAAYPKTQLNAEMTIVFREERQ